MGLVLRKYSEIVAVHVGGRVVKMSAEPAEYVGETALPMRHGRVSHRLPIARLFAMCLLAAVGALALASCGEEEERRPVASSPASAPEAAPPLGAGSAAKGVVARGGPAREWLDVGDDTPPEVFLATRSAPAGAPASAEAVAEIATLLSEADAVFDENRRMLANRTLQLERMLGEISVVESPQALLGGFIQVGRAIRRIGYSDLCQHYFNLRAAGASRDDALATLAAPAAERRNP
ncbi:hypothetical protein LJE71_17015 [Xanthobacter autotrophicus]|uniref:hypothetical protein n=1 Tax=Xanthobacter autotrophicus TaxID=280 RepID=UPI001E366393|nr:hypothetical protein [Xanthobacter autotrophicus]UDQ87975.1 hypothetical protein LJE71_17015 [Xanthobacter autotrophicus]